MSETDGSLIDDLRSLVEPERRGDPQSPLPWISQELREMGHEIGRSRRLLQVCTLVGKLLHKHEGGDPRARECSLDIGAFTYLARCSPRWRIIPRSVGYLTR
jgi:hypothetical protein